MISRAPIRAGLGLWTGTAGAVVQTTATVVTNADQATALPITGEIVELTAVVASTGVRLPADALPGDELVIANIDGTNAVAVYPYFGGRVNYGSVNDPYSLAKEKAVKLVAVSRLNWVVV